MENNIQRVKMLSFPINDLSFTTQHDCNGVARDGFLWCPCQLEWKFYFHGSICLRPLYDMINAYNYMHLSMACFIRPLREFSPSRKKTGQIKILFRLIKGVKTKMFLELPGLYSSRDWEVKLYREVFRLHSKQQKKRKIHVRRVRFWSETYSWHCHSLAERKTTL